MFEDLDAFAFGDDVGPTGAPASACSAEQTATTGGSKARGPRSRDSTATTDVSPAQRPRTGTVACTESTVITSAPVLATTIVSDAPPAPIWAPTFSYEAGKMVVANDRVLSHGGVAFALSKASVLPLDMAKNKEMANTRLSLTTLQSMQAVSS